MPFLHDCLQSIVQQTELDWELIAVEDHSTDSSAELLQIWGEKDSRIKVFKNPGKGIIPALRKAYAESKGELISRMDADDKMMPRKLERLKEVLLMAGPGHLATAFVQYFSEKQLGDGYLKYEQWLNELSLTSSNFQDIYKECVIPSPCWMIHRADLDNCGAFELDTYPEDYDLCFRFYRTGLNIVTCKEVLHLWRDHPFRSSRTDPHYAHQSYFELKLPYFLNLDYKPQRPLVLWGAGKKGKQIAKMLSDKGIPFRWLCNTPTKWGRVIHGAILEPSEVLLNINQPQVLVAIAGPDDQELIKNQLSEWGLKLQSDYFFFC